jgi:hypothetical protein
VPLLGRRSPTPLITACNQRVHGRPMKPPLAPPPPSGSYKRRRPSLGPQRTRPHSPPLLSELLYHRQFAITARPSRRLTSPGERRADFTVLPSPHPTLVGELPSSGAVGDQAPVSVPPRSGGPLWNEPPAVHEPWIESIIISYCKIILKPEKSPPSKNNPLPFPKSTRSPPIFMKAPGI